MKKKEVFNIIFTAIMVSLTVVFDFLSELIPFINFTYGGNISLVMFPLALISITCNSWYGICGGICYGFINYLMDGYGFNIISIFLDYTLAYASIAIIGLFRKQILEGKKGYFILGFALGIITRWILTSISGMLNAEVFGIDSTYLENIFGAGKSSILYLALYSFVLYNMPYIFLSGALCIIVGILTYKVLIMRRYESY